MRSRKLERSGKSDLGNQKLGVRDRKIEVVISHFQFPTHDFSPPTSEFPLLMHSLIWGFVVRRSCNKAPFFHVDLGDCWYEPVEDRAGRVQDNTITRGPYQQDATDCALQCRNTNDTGNECWAFTYNITSSECSLHYVNESQVDAPSVTFLENDYNYALQAEAAVLYVRRCFEGKRRKSMILKKVGQIVS